MSSFIDLLRIPDDVKIQTDTTPFRFEEYGISNVTDARVSFEIADDVLRIILEPSDSVVKQIRLRFNGDIGSGSNIVHILGDSFERCTADDLTWKSFLPHERLAWYIHIYNGVCIDSYGVRTGCNSFAYWQCDPRGLTLWLDVRNGSDGIVVDEPLVCAEVVCRAGIEGEMPFIAARDFCRMMCPYPALPKRPIYGFNNWYWAYGGIDEDTVIHEAEYLASMSSSVERPFMVIDDGWQLPHSKGYNGGPWNMCNERFSSMGETAEKISECGCVPGIWMRPLLTMSHVPDEAIYLGGHQKIGTVLDPSHPFTFEKLTEDISRISNWGYKLIKHDFSTFDLFGRGMPKPARFYDKELTNAQIVKQFYRTIQNAAGDSVVLGCNTINHLAAGIHQIQRVGDDTSGRSFEWTRRHGIHSMMRLPQTHTFFSLDPDCAAFTERVSKELNFDFLEAAAISGCAVFASVKPGILTKTEEKRLSEILTIAANIKSDEFAVPIDWTRTSAPMEYSFRDEKIKYDWYKEYQGARLVLDWLN